jgi:uncharacterized protein
MSLSMYDASIPVFVRLLGNLSLILAKAASYAEAKKIEPSVLVNARLAPDMLPLSRQIQIASDVAKGCAARLAGIEVPIYPDDEVSIRDLQLRLEKTIHFIQEVSPAAINGSEQREISFKMGGQNIALQGQPYLLDLVLPNFYFHITTAYAILRHNGLDIGKKDYLGSTK